MNENKGSSGHERGEYAGQGSVSVRPLMKQSKAAAAGKKGAPPRVATAVDANKKVAGTHKGGPGYVRPGADKSGSTAPRRFKVRRHQGDLAMHQHDPHNTYRRGQ